MPTKTVKNTHWSPTRTPTEQSKIDAIRSGAVKRAVPRDALTGRPLEKGAQTMTGWYLPPMPSGAGSGAGGEPTRYCHLPRAVTRVAPWDASNQAPDTTTDEETDATPSSKPGKSRAG